MARLLENNRPVIGETRPSATSLGTRDHINAATGQSQATVLVGGAAEIDAAVSVAVVGQRAWMAAGAEARRSALLKLAALIEAEADQFATLAALECGNPVTARGSSLALSWIRYYAGWADKIEGGYSEPLGMAGLAYTRHEPYGVVGAIIPWNSPIVAIAMKVIPALAAGNAVILKPPTITPFVAIRIGELALEAGLPAGTLCVVPGDAEAGEALIDHEAVGKISFTGGGLVARSVMHRCADQLKPLALELGGKSANIICADADLAAAATMAAGWSLVPLAGQGCVLPTRVYAHEAIYDELLDRVREIGRGFRQGDPLDPQTVIGPVIHEAAAQRIMGVIDRAKVESGGSVVLGGRRGQGDLAVGAFVEPTIIAGVAHDSHIAREEVFGPVLAIVRFRDDEDAVAMANDSRFGLGAYVHTRDLSRAHRMASELQAGCVGVNGMLPMAPNQPFGGYKTSGFGREGGRQGLEEFLQVKQVAIHLS